MGANTTSAAASSSSAPPQRTKSGCITCRLRKKRCDQAKPKCRACARLGIECLGYGAKRPQWLAEKSRANQWRKEIHEAIQAHKAKRARVHSTASGDSEGTPALDDPADTRARTSQPRSPSPSQIRDDVLPWDTSAFADITGDTWESIIQQTQPLPPVNIDPPDLNPPEISSALASADSSLAAANALATSPGADQAVQDMWKILFGPGTPAPTSNFSPPTPAPPAPPIQSRLVPLAPSIVPYLAPKPAASAEPSTVTDLGYLHHYLNVVLPVQYRFGFKSMAELVAPLAMTCPKVLSSASSLAALHLTTQRSKRPFNSEEGEASLTDVDAIIALTSHQEATDRLKFLSSSDLTSEDVIVSALFAISFHLFSGGTSKGWSDMLETARRCLASALASSPEVTTSPAPSPSECAGSPWQRYRPLIAVMVWMDILGSVTQNKSSPLLPTYRRLLDRTPLQAPNRARLDMKRIMGCDDSTLLALARIVELSEWKAHAEKASCLSYKELVQRAAAVESLLAERPWRQGFLDEQPTSDEKPEMLRLISDIFFSATHVLLAVTVNGPYPKVLEVAAAVQETISGLNLLDLHYPNIDLNRALILPITIAGCHCETRTQRESFRRRFSDLSPDATAFGNSSQALSLMEEVWRRRDMPGGQRVDWRETMKDMGWQAGILLI